MGFFDFLFKKKQSEPKPKPEPEKKLDWDFDLNSELETSEKPVQETNRHYENVSKKTFKELSLADIGGYVSPSGGFVNYAKFKVVGINPNTGKKNTKRYEVQTEEDACNAAVAEGLAEPFIVTAEPLRQPTQPQIEYALALGAVLSDGICFDDISSIISRITSNNTSAPNVGFSKYAHFRKARFSRFVNNERLFWDMFYQSDNNHKIILFTYLIYMRETKGEYQDLRNLPFYDDLCEFGARAATDQSVIKSLESLEYHGFENIHKGTKIYKATAEFLKDWL